MKPAIASRRFSTEKGVWIKKRLIRLLSPQESYNKAGDCGGAVPQVYNLLHAVRIWWGYAKTDQNPESDSSVSEAVMDRIIHNAYEVHVSRCWSARAWGHPGEGRGPWLWCVAYALANGDNCDTLALERACCDKLKHELTERFYKDT